MMFDPRIPDMHNAASRMGLVGRQLRGIAERAKDLAAILAGTPVVPPVNAGLPGDPVARAVAHLPDLERALRENVLGFWLPRCLDRVHGGYLVNFDRQGRPTGKTTKGILPQCRMLWLFARAFREGHGGQELLEAAALGFRFVAQKMWDAQSGGFVWEVDASGDTTVRGKKHLVGQTYPLYAFSEFYLASNRRDVLELATQLFDLMDAKTRDDQFGGYLEFFDRDWRPAPSEEIGYLSAPARVKLMNSHLHVAEALTVFHEASTDLRSLVEERLRELIRIQSDTVVRKEFGVCTDRWERNWTPCTGRAARRVSYGHNLENVSILSEACTVVGLDNNSLLPVYTSMFAYALRYGFDARRGGFFESGPLGHTANWRDMIWWVQAEALWCAMRMFELTRDVEYLRVFNRVWEFVNWAQIDWTRGEWYERVRPSGRVTGDKAHIWKCGYHNGRALIECISGLRKLQSAAPRGSGAPDA
jgi:mannobiose 2-epimerase